MEHAPINKSKTSTPANAGKTVKLQAKLSVNQPGDAYEQEADKVASQVTQAAGPSIQAASLPISPVQQGSVAPAEGMSDVASSPSFENYIATLNGGGQSLPADTRDFFESRFGHDFGDVRIHTDSRAMASSAAINAHAYTAGNHIVFNEGRYSPEGSEGKQLLAHELTHVVQQSGGETGTATHAGDAGGGGAVQCQLIQAEGGEEKESWFSTIGEILDSTDKATGGLIPGIGFVGSALGGAGDLGKGIESGDPAGLLAGGLGFGEKALDLAEKMSEEGMGEGLGVASGILGMGKSGVDAYSDFSKGNYGAGAWDVTKGVGQGISTLAKAGGFSLLGEGGLSGAMGAISEGGLGVLGTEGGIAGSALTMDAGAALAGGGAEGLAALGPLGALIGAGIGGVGMGMGLDSGVNKLGQWITGNDKKDYSISAGIGNYLTSQDEALTSLWADPSKPLEKQTIAAHLIDYFDL